MTAVILHPDQERIIERAIRNANALPYYPLWGILEETPCIEAAGAKHSAFASSLKGRIARLIIPPRIIKDGRLILNAALALKDGTLLNCPFQAGILFPSKSLDALPAQNDSIASKTIFPRIFRIADCTIQPLEEEHTHKDGTPCLPTAHYESIICLSRKWHVNSSYWVKCAR